MLKSQIMNIRSSLKTISHLFLLGFMKQVCRAMKRTIFNNNASSEYAFLIILRECQLRKINIAFGIMELYPGRVLMVDSYVREGNMGGNQCIPTLNYVCVHKCMWPLQLQLDTTAPAKWPTSILFLPFILRSFLQAIEHLFFYLSPDLRPIRGFRIVNRTNLLFNYISPSGNNTISRSV